MKHVSQMCLHIWYGFPFSSFWSRRFIIFQLLSSSECLQSGNDSNNPFSVPVLGPCSLASFNILFKCGACLAWRLSIALLKGTLWTFENPCMNVFGATDFSKSGYNVMKQVQLLCAHGRGLELSKKKSLFLFEEHIVAAEYLSIYFCLARTQSFYCLKPSSDWIILVISAVASLAQITSTIVAKKS